jgi:hypothetical protein
MALLKVAPPLRAHVPLVPNRARRWLIQRVCEYPLATGEELYAENGATIFSDPHQIGGAQPGVHQTSA